MTLLNTLLTALQGVSANKLRAILTTLGVVMGVASVIAMLSPGNGARVLWTKAFRFLGSDEVQINAKLMFDDGELSALGKNLTYDDGLQMANEAPLVDQVEMFVTTSGKIRFKRANLEVAVGGATADAINVVICPKRNSAHWLAKGGTPHPRSISVRAGFSPRQKFYRAMVCVLGFQTALDLFVGDNPLGESVWVNRKPCRSSVSWRSWKARTRKIGTVKTPTNFSTCPSAWSSKISSRKNPRST